MPWTVLNYECVDPSKPCVDSEFACSSACSQAASQAGVPGTCAGYAFRPEGGGYSIPFIVASCVVYFGDPTPVSSSSGGYDITGFVKDEDYGSDRFYTCTKFIPPPPPSPPPAREWPNGACRPNAQTCPGKLQPGTPTKPVFCVDGQHGFDVSKKNTNPAEWYDNSCSCCSGTEAECSGSATYCAGADVHQCLEYATQDFKVSLEEGLGLASANVACAWEPAGHPSAWNGTHALSRTMFTPWPFTYSFPKQQGSGSGSTLGRPWDLSANVQTSCAIDPDPVAGYVPSPDLCNACPFLFDETCSRYLGNPYAWPGLQPNPMGGADWSSSDYRAWVKNDAGYFDDPTRSILNDGIVAEEITHNNTILTGISEHWLEAYPTKVELTDVNHPDGAGHLYVNSPTIQPILLDLGSPQRVQEIQISYVKQGVLDGMDTVDDLSNLVGNDFTAFTNPTNMIVAGTNDPTLLEGADIDVERSGLKMGDELYYNRVVGGVDGSRSGACSVPPGAVCVCVGNTKVAMFPNYEPGVYATNHTVSIHTGPEGASEYRPEWPAVQYIQVMMVWPAYPCTPLLDTGTTVLNGRYIQVFCGGIALSEIKVFVDDDRAPFDVHWVDANYHGGGNSGNPECSTPHLQRENVDADQASAGSTWTAVAPGTEPPYVPPSDGPCWNADPSNSQCEYGCSSTLNSTNWDEDGRYTGYISCPETCAGLGGFAVGARCSNAVYKEAGYDKSNQAWVSLGSNRDCGTLFQRLMDPSCDYVDSKYRDGTEVVPSCILEDDNRNPNGINDCVTGICWDDTGSSQFCERREGDNPGDCTTYIQCQCYVPKPDWRPPSPPPPVNCGQVVEDGGRCGEGVEGQGICRHCCSQTGFCGSSGLYCDADKGNQFAYSLILINPEECPDSPPPAPPPGAPPPKTVRECCDATPTRPAKCCVYPADEPQAIPCCADACGHENVCPSLLPPDGSGGGAAASRRTLSSAGDAPMKNDVYDAAAA